MIPESSAENEEGAIFRFVLITKLGGWPSLKTCQIGPNSNKSKIVLLPIFASRRKHQCGVWMFIIQFDGIQTVGIK